MNIQKGAKTINKDISPEHLLGNASIELPHHTSAMSCCGWLWRKSQQPHRASFQNKNNKLTSYGEPKHRLRSALFSFFLITGLLTGCGSDNSTGGTEILENYIKASNTDREDRFGVSIALSADGNTLAIGAYHEDSNAKNTDATPNQADNSASNAGAVYVFTRSGTSWSQEAYLKASNTDGDDFIDGPDAFGGFVALSGDGNTLAIGAIGEDSNAKNTDTTPNQADNSTLGAGAVYVFTRSGTSWSQEAYLKASNTDAKDRFGFSTALSNDGNTLAVGAIGEDSNAKNTNATPDQTDNSASNAGAVYVFTRTGASWSQQAYLKASNTDRDSVDERDFFGSSIALRGDGNTLAVGANREDSNAKNTDATPNQADSSATSAGAVYVFTRTGINWSQQAYLKASNTDRGDIFGGAVALSDDGSTLAVGAVSEDSNAKSTDAMPDQENDSVSSAGAVYVFTLTETSWSQQNYLKAPNTDTDDGFGGAVALSADGSTLAIGAGGESSNAKNTDAAPNPADNSAFLAGAVYIY